MISESLEFTDKQLADLYLSLQKQYLHLTRNLSLQEVYDTLGCALLSKIIYPGGDYYALRNSPMARKKIFDIFNFFITTIPQARHHMQPLSLRQNDWFTYPNFAQLYPQSDVPRIQLLPFNFQYNRVSWFDFLLRLPLPRERNADSFCKMLFLLILTGIVFIIAYLSIGYIFNVLLDSYDRLIHNEGRMYATISILSVLAGAVMGSIASAMFLTGILNPFGLIGILCIATSSVIIGATTGYMTNLIQDSSIRNANPNVLDPNDPYRICLTASDEQHIRTNLSPFDNTFDSIKVKCAIIALRAEIGTMPSASLRMFSAHHQKARENLALIRKLRRGECDKIRVGEFELNVGIVHNTTSAQFDIQEPIHGIVLQYSNDNRPPVMGEIVGGLR